jgi:penicillin-binding protein 1A
VIRRVEDSAGKVLFDAKQDVKSEQVIDEGVADTVNSVLSGVLTKGTGNAASLRVVAAGKTGTTTDSKDAWFAGYTCHLTAAVWMGYEQPKPMKTYRGKEVSGGTVPAAIWKQFMSSATQGDEACQFPDADFGKRVLNQRLSGMRSTSTSSIPRGVTSSTAVTEGAGITTSTSTPKNPAVTAAPKPIPSTTVSPPTTSAPATTAAPAPATTSAPTP